MTYYSTKFKKKAFLYTQKNSRKTQSLEQFSIKKFNLVLDELSTFSEKMKISVEALRMSLIGGKTKKRIAEDLGITTNTLTSRLNAIMIVIRELSSFYDIFAVSSPLVNIQIKERVFLRWEKLHALKR
jgi:hypothetical protein